MPFAAAAPMEPAFAGQENGDQPGLTPIAPTDGVLSIGAPPVRPVLPRSVRIERAQRMMRNGNGRTVISPALGRSRVEVPVAWGPMRRAERDLLEAWLRDELLAGENGSAYAMTIEPDGPGNGELLVRLIGPVVWRAVKGHGAQQLHEVPEVMAVQA